MVESILNSISNTKTNNLSEFKKYLESDQGTKFKEHSEAIEYSYGMNMSVYNDASDYGLVKVSPNGLMDKLGLSQIGTLQSTVGMSSPMNQEVWIQMPDSQVLRDKNYQLIDGSWPQSEDEILLAVNSKNEITDFALYSLGLLDQDALVENYNKVIDGKTNKLENIESKEYTNDDFLGMELKVVSDSALYAKENGLWIDRSENEDFVQDVLNHKANNGQNCWNRQAS